MTKVEDIDEYADEVAGKRTLTNVEAIRCYFYPTLYAADMPGYAEGSRTGPDMAKEDEAFKRNQHCTVSSRGANEYLDGVRILEIHGVKSVWGHGGFKNHTFYELDGKTKCVLDKGDPGGEGDFDERGASIECWPQHLPRPPRD